MRRAVAFWFAVISSDVSAQLSGSLTLVSDYRYRGVTLSHNNPAAQIGIAYDDARNWYAGAFASTAQLASPSTRELHAISFVGYAWRTPSGLTWDLGANYSAFTGPRSYSYPEFYWGLAFQNVSARVYYAPRYLGGDSGAVYGEVNGAQPIFDRLRLLAHVGVLHADRGNPYAGGRDYRVIDGRIGVGFDLDPFHFQVSWVGISSANAVYPITGIRSQNRIVLTLSRSF